MFGFTNLSGGGSFFGDNWSSEGYGHHAHGGVPPWYQFDCFDLARFIRESGIDLLSVRRILDVGGGLGLRSMLATTANPGLNRPDVHVTCVDIAPLAIHRGVRLWDAVRHGRSSPDLFGYRPEALPRHSMAFRLESAADLPLDLLNPSPDVLIDWMFTHGLPRPLWAAYLSAIKAARPRFILFKCFSRELATVDSLKQTITGIDKHLFRDADVDATFGPEYRRTPVVHDSPEIKNPTGHTDGIIAAKRAYVLERVG